MGFENFWTTKNKEEKDLQDEIQAGLEEFEEFKQDKEDKESETEYEIPSDLISTSDIFERQGVTLEEIHEWYSAAISRRDREPLEEERFISHFEGMSFDSTFAFGEREKGYLLGYLKYGVFVPTHFAPKTMRGGYELIKSLGESADVPAVMSVTDDLEETLQKMPSWQTLDIPSFLAQFREELTEKKIVYNSHPDTKNLMLGLVAEYLEEAKNSDLD